MRDEYITSFIIHDVILNMKYAFKFFYELKRKILKAGKSLKSHSYRRFTNTSPELPIPFYHFSNEYFIKNPSIGFLLPRIFKIVLLPRRVSLCKIDLLEHNLSYNNLMPERICI
jgi:hypothetical protein